MRLFATLLVLSSAACATREAGRIDPAGAQVDRRAALATVTVENQTAAAISVAYRHAIGATGAVDIGSVAPGGVKTLAPVPAGEPIVLTLRDAYGRELSLPPRTLELGADWHWVVPADARFAFPGAPP